METDGLEHHGASRLTFGHDVCVEVDVVRGSYLKIMIWPIKISSYQDQH
jgi:hypothetical protein